MSQDQKNKNRMPAGMAPPFGSPEREVKRLRELLRRTYKTFQMQVPDFNDKEVEAAIKEPTVELPSAPVEGSVE